MNNREFSLDSLPSEHSCNACYYCTQSIPLTEEYTPEPSFGKRHSISTSIKNIRKRRKSSIKPPQTDAIKLALREFFTTYCGAKNWLKGNKENGTQKYNLEFEDRNMNNASLDCMYSLLLYLGKIIGIDKKCITHSISLFMCSTSQMNALCDEMALILQTLEFHNDDKLWKYTYSFMFNIAAYFQFIQPFIGSYVVIKQPVKARKINGKYKSQIRALRNFFSTYSNVNNWFEAQAKQYDEVRTFIFKFEDTKPINVRISFIYSLTCYLINIVGVNKSLKTMMFVLLGGISGQIETFSNVFGNILLTLEYYNDYKLWKYVYSFLYNITAYYKHIRIFVGMKTVLENTNDYCLRLRGNCMYYINKQKSKILVNGYIKEMWFIFGLNDKWIIHAEIIIPVIQKYYIKVNAQRLR
eukprot:172231_1